MLVVIKGAGDLATGIAIRLKKSGFDIIMTEIAKPTVVRHTVAFASVIEEQVKEIEGVTGKLCKSTEQIKEILEKGQIAIIVDPKADIVKRLEVDIVVDAIIAKKNLGTTLTDAQVVIGVGPGFVAGEDCHYVIETKRGHYLGQVIERGSAIPNTGIPGEIGGYTKERIIRSPKAGKFRPVSKIGDHVQEGEIVAYVDELPVQALLKGTVRGMLMREMNVTKAFKCGDIDPRCILKHCFTVSDKARSIGGGVLEAIMRSKIVLIQGVIKDDKSTT